MMLVRIELPWMRPSSAAVVVLLGATVAFAASDDWTGFQNGGCLQFAAEAAPPLHWSTDDGVAWRVQLAGYGQSSPVGNSQSIYVTSTSGANKERLHIQAFDRATGAQRWRFDADNHSPEESTNYISRAAPSPAWDADGVIALFEGGDVFALDPAGHLRWQRHLATEFGPIQARHGLASSLEQNEDCVFVWIERPDQPYLVALEKATGEVRWKVDGLGTTSWSSPRLIDVAGRPHLVLSGIGRIVGIDPERGDRLWELDDVARNSTPTPVPVGDGRFLVGATVGGAAAEQETDGGRANSNGLVEVTPTAEGSFAVRFLWRAERATSSFGSPLAHDGHAYFVNASGVVYCLDLETGEERYARRTASSVWATPFAVHDRIYLFGKNGTTTVIASGPKFQVLATNALWATSAAERPSSGAADAGSGDTLYAAALIHRDLILRSGEHLYRIAADGASAPRE